MEFELADFYEVLAPRCTVLVSTIDKEQQTNAAPFSFVMPVSMEPPLVVVGMVPGRRTLSNIRETGEFVLNIPPEPLLEKLLICGQSLPEGASKFKEAGLKEKKSSKVKAPGIRECAAWLECKLEFEKEAGDHIMVVGRVVHVECKDQFASGGTFDIKKAKPLMHVRRRRFVVAERVIEAPKV